MATLQTKHKGFYDEHLFAHFRVKPQREEIARIEEILILLIQADKLRSMVKEDIPLPQHPDTFVRAMKRQGKAHTLFHKAVRKLNERLSRYRWLGVVTGDVDALGIAYEAVDVEHGWPVMEQAYIQVLLEKLQTPGEIARFRHCASCADWYFATTAPQRFCSEACRRRYIASSDEFKTKRRLYMQQTYRPQQKQREIESLALAKRIAAKKRKGN